MIFIHLWPFSMFNIYVVFRGVKVNQFPKQELRLLNDNHLMYQALLLIFNIIYLFIIIILSAMVFHLHVGLCEGAIQLWAAMWALEIEPWVLWKGIQCSQPQSHFSSPTWLQILNLATLNYSRLWNGREKTDRALPVTCSRLLALLEVRLCLLPSESLLPWSNRQVCAAPSWMGSRKNKQKTGDLLWSLTSLKPSFSQARALNWRQHPALNS